MRLTITGLDVNMQTDASMCSERFAKGVRWLENQLRFDESRTRSELENCAAELLVHEKPGSRADRFVLESKIERLNMNLQLRYGGFNPEAMYVLKKVNSSAVNEFMLAAKNETFWEDAKEYFVDDAHKLWFLKELGFGDDPHFQGVLENLIKDQSVDGLIPNGDDTHSGPLRVLVAVMPESKALSNAIDYWLRKWRDLSYFSAKVAIGILALTELDWEKYSGAVKEGALHLQSTQGADGSWGGVSKISDTSYAIWALSRVNGISDPSAKKGLQWLVRQQQEDGSWQNWPTDTAEALLGLLAMDEGPKISVEFMDYELAKLNQSSRRQKTVFVCTSPPYKNLPHAEDIHNKIRDMLSRARTEIRITSTFIDMLYAEIIDLKRQNPNLVVKIITRPKREAKGERTKVARKVIDSLNAATKGNVVELDLIHSRMVIIDDEEVLVSSADLTRDQLVDEFNAGIWTSDEEAIRKAIMFFDSLFCSEKRKP